MKPVRLEPLFVERVWGSTDLTPWFANRSEPTGEVWFTSDDNQTSEGIPLRAMMERDGQRMLGTAVQPAFGGRFPILAKLLFTSDKLSVQVHPDDKFAQENEASPGKTEMWHVLRAERGATLAAGFRQALDVAELREALGTGVVEQKLQWWSARAGDSFFIPAKTVHAVGAGLVICEVQQNSDITYRLWDYGRGRPLHVEKALAVAELKTYPGPSVPTPFGGGELIASCPYFAVERLPLNDAVEWHSDAERFHLLMVTQGTGELQAGQQRVPIEQGQCWLVPACCGLYRLTGPELEILRVYVPA